MRILVTGSYGLVGMALASACQLRGWDIVPFDLVRPDAIAVEDICDIDLLRAAAADCDGVVHLAAISRVAWGESRPDLCHTINVGGTAAVTETVLSAARQPWLIFASSREVYGEPPHMMISEDDPIAPLNHYGRSKAAGEALIAEARASGARTAIARLSNVYGGRRDHPDRAVPALVSRALRGADLEITGSGNYFDFVHVRDTVDGLIALIERLVSGQADLPPIQFATGIATSLGALARLAVQLTDSTSRVLEQPARAFDVSGFCGTPLRADQMLGWSPRITLEQGIADLAADLRDNGPMEAIGIPDPEALRAVHGGTLGR